MIIFKGRGLHYNWTEKNKPIYIYISPFFSKYETKHLSVDKSDLSLGKIISSIKIGKIINN